MDTSLGVYATRSADVSIKPFGAQTTLIRDLIHVGGEVTPIFAFGPTDLNLQTLQVLGWRPTKHHTWVAKMYPLPAVVWDRLIDNKEDSADLHVREILLTSNLKWINHPTAQAKLHDKLATYDLLHSERINTPTTKLFTKEGAQLEGFLATYPVIFIKPRFGMKGREVIQIRRTDEDPGHISMSGLPGGPLDIQGAAARLEEMTIAEDFVIQQGIEPPRHIGHAAAVAFDVRVLLQKPEDDWIISGMMARVGKEQASTSNLATGGQSYPINHIVNKRMVALGLDVLVDRLTKISIRTAAAFDCKVGGLREIGVDVLFNSECDPVILECNSKPGRKGFRDLSLSSAITPEEGQAFGEVRMKSLENIIQATRSLMGSP